MKTISIMLIFIVEHIDCSIAWNGGKIQHSDPILYVKKQENPKQNKKSRGDQDTVFFNNMTVVYLDVWPIPFTLEVGEFLQETKRVRFFIKNNWVL